MNESQETMERLQAGPQRTDARVSGVEALRRADKKAARPLSEEQARLLWLISQARQLLSRNEPPQGARAKARAALGELERRVGEMRP